MNIISPCLNETHCKEWEKVTAKILSGQPLDEDDGALVIDDNIEVGRTPPTIEFRIVDPYPELDGMKGRASVFPESLFLLADRLINLSLEKCGLERLPYS